MGYNDCEILFCSFFLKQEFEYEYEIYDNYMMFCVKEGEFEFSVADGTPHIIKGGQIVICPPHKKFYRKMIKPSKFCMIKFSADVPENLCENSISVYDIFRFNTDLKALSDCTYCAEAELTPYFKHFCCDIWYSVLSQVDTEQKPLAEAVKYIKNNFTSDISVALVAQKNGYSAVGFINLFKKHYGTTPKNYISNLRINYAKHLLMSTQMSVFQTADMCGYADALYFSRIFKRYVGMPPTEFRKMHTCFCRP